MATIDYKNSKLHEDSIAKAEESIKSHYSYLSFQGYARLTTDPGTPSEGDAWIAVEDGDYTNFSLTGVNKGQILKYIGGEFITTNIAIKYIDNFTGEFDLTNIYGNIYRDYLPSASVTLAISDAVIGGFARVRIRANQTITYPSNWNFSGDNFVTDDDTLMNLIWIYFNRSYDIEITNKVVPFSSYIHSKEEFTNNTYDTNHWIIHDRDGSTITVESERLKNVVDDLSLNQSTFDWAGYWEFYDKFVLSLYMDWSGPGTYNASQEIEVIGKDKNGNELHELFRLMPSDDHEGYIRFRTLDNYGTTEIDNGTVPKGSTVKVIYDIKNYKTYFYHWVSGDGWTEVGNLAMKYSDTILDLRIKSDKHQGYVTYDGRLEGYFDNIYITYEDYENSVPTL